MHIKPWRPWTEVALFVIGLALPAGVLAAPVAGYPAPAVPQPIENAHLAATPYRELTSVRPDGTALHWFAPAAALASPAGRPVVIWLEGSGCNGQFLLRDGRLRYGTYAVLAELARGALVVAPEKRGIPFGHTGPGGQATQCPPEFIAHATLGERMADVSLLIDAVRALGADSSRILLVGHSEGADVAGNVARQRPDVTHVAFLAGGGPVQMFDFAVLLRREAREKGLPHEQVEAAVTALEEDFRKIQADPQSTTRFFRGHAFRRWSDYFAHPPMEGLLATKARLFVAHGTLDTSVPIESFDLLTMELVRARRTDVVVRRYAGTGHALGEPSANGPGLERAFQDVLAWFNGRPSAR